VGIVSPLIGYVIGYSSQQGKSQKRLLFAAGISLGFGFLSPQAFFYYLVGLVLGSTAGCIFRICEDSTAVLPNIGFRRTAGMLPSFVVTIGLVVYGLAGNPVPPGTGQGLTSFKVVGFLLLIPMILCGCWMVSQIARHHGVIELKRTALRTTAYIFATFLMYLCGLVLSGNIVGYSGIRLTFIDYLQPVLPGLGTPLLSRGINVPFTLSELGQFGGLQCWISVYCESSSGFAFAIAFLFVLASIATLFAVLNDRQPDQTFGFVIIFVTSLLMASLFLVDFTGGDQLLYIWGKTRFLEVPLYLLMFLSVLGIGRILPRVAFTVAVLWTLPTVIQVIPQWYANLNWLVGRIV
jgi:hypothetical protein